MRIDNELYDGDDFLNDVTAPITDPVELNDASGDPVYRDSINVATEMEIVDDGEMNQMKRWRS